MKGVYLIIHKNFDKFKMNIQKIIAKKFALKLLEEDEADENIRIKVKRFIETASDEDEISMKLAIKEMRLKELEEDFLYRFFIYITAVKSGDAPCADIEYFKDLLSPGDYIHAHGECCELCGKTPSFSRTIAKTIDPLTEELITICNLCFKDRLPPVNLNNNDTTI